MGHRKFILRLGRKPALLTLFCTNQFSILQAEGQSQPHRPEPPEARGFSRFPGSQVTCASCCCSGNCSSPCSHRARIGLVCCRELDDGFDVRTAFPNCTVLAKVRDQSACGSCWAFGSTETFEGRKCIAQGQDIEYSADDTAGCATYAQENNPLSRSILCGRMRVNRSAGMGCDGGQPDSALEWISSTGVVTGGDYVDVGTGTVTLSCGRTLSRYRV